MNIHNQVILDRDPCLDDTHHMACLLGYCMACGGGREGGRGIQSMYFWLRAIRPSHVTINPVTSYFPGWEILQNWSNKMCIYIRPCAYESLEHWIVVQYQCSSSKLSSGFKPIAVWDYMVPLYVLVIVYMSRLQWLLSPGLWCYTMAIFVQWISISTFALTVCLDVAVQSPYKAVFEVTCLCSEAVEVHIAPVMVFELGPEPAWCQVSRGLELHGEAVYIIM